MIRRPPRSPLFPSTTLFRSHKEANKTEVLTILFLPSSLMKFSSSKARSEEHTSELQSQFHLLFPLFFFNDTATTEISPLPLHDALPISQGSKQDGSFNYTFSAKFTDEIQLIKG